MRFDGPLCTHYVGQESVWVAVDELRAVLVAEYALAGIRIRGDEIGLMRSQNDGSREKMVVLIHS